MHNVFDQVAPARSVVECGGAVDKCGHLLDGIDGAEDWSHVPLVRNRITGSANTRQYPREKCEHAGMCRSLNRETVAFTE